MNGQSQSSIVNRQSSFLIVNPYGIGDVLCSLPLVRALRTTYPTATLGFVCNRRTESLVRLWPELGKVIVFEKDEFRALWRYSKRRWWRAVCRLFRELRTGHWDAAFDLSLNWEFGAALAASGAKVRCGFDYRGRGKFLTHRVGLTGFDHRPLPEYYLDLLKPLRIPRPTAPSLTLTLPVPLLKEAKDWLFRQGIIPDRPIAALVPGGGASWGPNARMKRWPPDHFAHLAAQLLKNPFHNFARQAGLNLPYEGSEMSSKTTPWQLITLGDMADQPICRAVAQAVRPPIAVLEPAPSLALLAGAIAHCRLAIGNDSGALHLAVAVGTPSVTIFGPASPIVYGPYPPASASTRHRVAVESLACRPCYSKFQLPPCPWKIRCLTTLNPDDVYETARELLAA